MQRRFGLLQRLLVLLVGVLCSAGLAVLALLLWPLPDMPRPGVAGDFLIHNVAVVDVAAGRVLPDRHVIVRRGRVENIARAGAETDTDTVSLTLIDGTGRFLLPGLWDMHTHTTKHAGQYQHPLFVANGVTGVRELWGCMSEPDSFFGCAADRNRWNAAVARGDYLAPRYVRHSSFQINGGNEVPEGYPDFFRARDAEEAQALVDFHAGQGGDFLKPYTELPVAPYLALAEAARKRGLTLEGHRPIKVSLPQALAAGQRSIEHARLFLLECFAGAAEFRAAPDPLRAYTRDLRQRLLDEQDPERCRRLMSAMADSETWWSPTLQTLKMGALADDPAYRHDKRLVFVPYLYRTLMWMPDADRKAKENRHADGRKVNAELYALALSQVGEAHALGVKLLAGTDAFDTYVFPGFSLHDELADLVDAGLSPADALRAATIDAARFSGRADEFGSIEAGKVADLVLLDANPLEEIRNTRKVAAVFLNGRFLDRAALDELLAFAERQAGSVQHNLHIFWAALRSPLLRVQFAD